MKWITSLTRNHCPYYGAKVGGCKRSKIFFCEWQFTHYTFLLPLIHSNCFPLFKARKPSNPAVIDLGYMLGLKLNHIRKRASAGQIIFTNRPTYRRQVIDTRLQTLQGLKIAKDICYCHCSSDNGSPWQKVQAAKDLSTETPQCVSYIVKIN